MSIMNLSETREMRRIEALLDRMDPTPAPCTVPGCVHRHDHAAAVADAPPALAVA